MADQMALTKTSRAGLPTQPSRAVRQQAPAFLNKLYAMVNDPNTDDLIHWSDEGDSFFVPNHERFGRELLPRFFKHGNFSSFVRQLNMYGFHKVPLVNQGVLQNETENELWQFASPHFQRGQPDLLMLIQRKKAGTGTNQAGGHAGPPSDQYDLPATIEPTGTGAGGSGTRSPPSSDSRALDISAIASALASIKRHQTALSSELKGLHDSDERLWDEAQSARKRLDQHQDTINRILKFLAGVFGNGAAGAGVHGARVRGHGQGDNDSSNEGDGPSTALVPRKRPRLMIEHSGSNEDLRAPPSSKAKEKARISHAAQLDDDDDDSDWAEEHLLVPIDDHSVASASPSQETPLARPSAQGRAGSEARIESVATSPAAASVPPTPGIAQVHEVTPTPTLTAQTLGVPSNTNSTPSGIPQAAPFMTPQPHLFMPNQPYSMPSQALTTNTGFNSVPPLDPTSANDQAAWQNLLNSPTGMQMFLNAMSQPSSFPTLSTMPGTVPGTDGMHGQAGNYAFPNPYSNLNPTGQLIQTTPNPFAGLVPQNQYPAYDPSGHNMMGALPDSNMLSLFNNNTGMVPLDQLGAHSAQLAQTTDKHKAIDARVDALGQSLNALLGHINLDPTTMLPLDHTDAVDSSQHLGQASQPIDFSSLLQHNAPDIATAPITGADFDAFDTNSGFGEHQPNTASLDEVGTVSTASSPNLDPRDITSNTKGTPTRKSKRKSDAMEVDDSVATRAAKSKRPAKKK